MADKKISQLTGAATPLDGTEVLPIVQSGSTVKVPNNDLRPKQIQSNATSGVLQIAGPAAATTRVMTTPNANFTVARTDAAQTFTGLQTISNGADIGSSGVSPVVKLSTTATNTHINFVDLTNSKNNYINFNNDVIELYNNAVTKKLEIGTDLTFNSGNFVVGTAAKGIDFSANTHAAGMTSELLNWYEEGTWTPTDASGAGLTFAQASGSYTRIGRQVTAWGFVTYPGTADASGVEIGGLPFTSANVDAVRGGGMIGFCDASTVSSVLTNKNGTAVKLYDSSGVQIVNSTMNNKSIYYAVTYFV